MQIQLLQLNPKINDFKNNIDNLNSKINSKSDLIICPELTLTGYPPQDLLLQNNFIKQAENSLQSLKNTNQPIIIGSPYKFDNQIYNQAIVWQKKPVYQYNKCFLPNQNVFDEQRYFKAGEQNQKHWLWQNTPVALCVCQDIWHEDYIEKYVKGAGLIICINASPFYIGKPAERQNYISKIAKKTHCAIIYVNAVGGQDELVFDGNSFAVDKTGKIICQLASFKEDTTTLNFDPTTQNLTHPNQNNIKQSSLKKLDNDYQNIIDALILGLKDYVLKTHHNSIWLGLSGGIDSALTAYIATKALGNKQVNAVMMPYKYTSEISLIDAKELANNLQINYQNIEITEIVNSIKNTLKNHLKNANEQAKNIALQNIQARARGIILLSLSNMLPSSLVLTTSNKSELAMGYSTLYGDMAGAFNPLKDVSKTQVFELCKWINKNEIIIPERTITRPPSAELAPNQKDEDSLPPYSQLDKWLADLINKNSPTTENQQIAKQISINEFKRFQSPPGTKITAQSLCKLDWRYPLVKQF